MRPDPPPRPDWAGAAVLLLALGLGIGFVAAIAGLTAPTEGAASLLHLIAGGMLAIVAGYVARADLLWRPRRGPLPDDPPGGIQSPP